LDLGAQVSIAAHFQVFQLGADGYDDAVNELALTLRERDLKDVTFIAPPPGQTIELTTPAMKSYGRETLKNEARMDAIDMKTLPFKWTFPISGP
jgi:hypothetical protein